jgi:hypothetical protein
MLKVFSYVGLDEIALTAADDGNDDLYLGDDEYKGCQDNSLIFDFAKEMAWQRYNNTDGDLVVGSRAFYPSLDQYFGLEGSLLNPMVIRVHLMLFLIFGFIFIKNTMH